MMTTYTAPPARTPTLRALWFAVLAGPLLWSVYFMAGYGLIEVSCRTGWLRDFNLLGLTLLSAILIGLTLVTFLAVLYAGFLAYRKEQQLRQNKPDQAEGGRAEQAGLFMARTGTLLSGLFALLILLTGISALILRPC